MANSRICSITGCGKPHTARGYCQAHYNRYRTANPINQTTRCSVDGCEKLAETRGLCGAHYSRLKRHGDPLAGRFPQGQAKEFFHNVVLPYQGDDCLIWPFSTSAGYGSIKINGKTEHVHRLVCETAHGQPPEGKPQAAHFCGNRRCVAQKHIRWASLSENQIDKWGHGRMSFGEHHGNSKLTESDVRKIRSMKGRRTGDEIAEIFGISAAWVSQIHRGIAWAWLK